MSPNKELLKILGPGNYPEHGPYFGGQCNQQRPERLQHLKELLWDAIERYSETDFNILEVGAWAGQSTLAMAEICAVAIEELHYGVLGHVFTIDTFEGTPGDFCNILSWFQIYSIFLYNLKASGLEQYVTPIKGNSQDWICNLPWAPYDFIYIDGDHKYQAVKSDILDSLSVLKPGGILCGDDADTQHPGVFKAIIETLPLYHEKDGFWWYQNEHNAL